MSWETTYEVDLDRWLQATVSDLEALARQSIFSLSERVIETTPWDTGFLRASWQPAIGELPRVSEDERTPKPGADYASANPEGRIQVAISAIKGGETFHLYNNAAYAMRLEFGFVGQDSLGRNYHQAGKFFVARAVHSWPQIVMQEASRLGFDVR